MVVEPRPRFAVNDPRAAVDAERRGLGFVVVPLEVAKTHAPELVRVSTDFGEPVTGELHVVYPSGRLLPHRVRLAIDWLCDPANRGYR